ncbi:MAG: cytochrome P450, partial [Bacteroidota bacterium]
ERAEHKKARGAIMTFGGGIHKCAGMNFAQNEILTITAHLFQRFEMQLVPGDENPTVERGLGACRPQETRIRFRRRKLDEFVPANIIEEALEAGCPHMARMMHK